MAGSGHRALVVDWSPKRVRVYDPLTGRIAEGAKLSDALAEGSRGRRAVFAVNARSAFARRLIVPKTGRAEVEKIVALQAASLFPIATGECVLGFRLGGDATEGGRIAAVGAVKTESLRQLYGEANASGLRVHAVLPLAFGAWLAAKERGLSNAISVEASGDTVALDLIVEGELAYSRSIPTPATSDALLDEIERTFKMAGTPAVPTLSTGVDGLRAEIASPKDPLAALADVAAIDRHLFSMELPEAVATERADAEKSKAVRALAAAIAAVALGAYAYSTRIPPKSGPSAGTSAAVRRAHARESEAKAQLARLDQSRRILEVAFHPGQTISDVLNVLSHAASADSWFTNLTIARGAPISLSGLALTDADVAKLSERVAKDPRFEAMKVVSASKTLIGKRPVTQFMVLGKLRGFLAFDRPSRGKRK